VIHMLDRAEDRQIVRSVIGLAHGFDRLCVAEGIETPAHQEMLHGMGCDWGQGYGLARPMPADTFIDWMHQRDAAAASGPWVIGPQV